jgi:hypothetical protein
MQGPVIRELDKFIDTPPEDIPKDSRYLLELDYSTLYNTTFERQTYWVLIMKAARQAGHRALAITKHRGRRRRGTLANITRRPCYDFTHNDAQMRRELGLQVSNRCRPRPDANGIENPSNKRLCKPD